MKAKVFAALAAAMAVGTACVFAANPFVDVPSDSWAYQSVVELADAGIIQALTGNISRAGAASLVTKPLKWSPKRWLTWTKLLSNSAPHQQIG